MDEVVNFDKIVGEGKALGRWQGKALFAVGPLPGETAEVTVTREKPRWAEATVNQIVTASDKRHDPREDHYLSCSPWQGVDYDYQIQLKREMLTEIYARPELGLGVTEVMRSPDQFGYRNKLEFALTAGSDGKLNLALHKRGSFEELVDARDGCVLGSQAMNQAAVELVTQLNSLGVGSAASGLIVRQSQSLQLVAVVTCNQKLKVDWTQLKFPSLQGLAVVQKIGHNQYKPLWQEGELSLSDEVGGVKLNYPWEAFFQVNVPAFAQALELIAGHIDQDTVVADLYGGVGTIGLTLAGAARRVIGIESNSLAARAAQRNAELNGISNYESLALLSQQLDPELLRGVDTLIVDPPRAGLHPDVTAELAQVRPRRIIYLSCNPITQARDVMALQSDYQASAVTGFDFYPGTLHLESLIVLDRVDG